VSLQVAGFDQLFKIGHASEINAQLDSRIERSQPPCLRRAYPDSECADAVDR